MAVKGTIEYEDNLTIAIDDAPDRGHGAQPVPKLTEASQGMFDMLIDKLAFYQREQCQPDIYLRPGIREVGIMEFDKIDSVYQQAEAMLPELKSQCALIGIPFKE